MKILFPHENFLNGDILPRNPIPLNPPPPEKNLSEKVLQPSKLAALPLGTLRDWVVLNDIDITYFDYAEQNGYLKILI